MERIILTASEGCLLTDGEVYGAKIYLAEGRPAADFREISRKEYEKMKEQEG